MDVTQPCHSTVFVSRPFVGHTFCTIETFANVAQAVQEYAFSTSELPVILSLEVTFGRKLHVVGLLQGIFLLSALLILCGVWV